MYYNRIKRVPEDRILALIEERTGVRIEHFA